MSTYPNLQALRRMTIEQLRDAREEAVETLAIVRATTSRADDVLRARVELPTLIARIDHVRGEYRRKVVGAVAGGVAIILFAQLVAWIG